VNWVVFIVFAYAALGMEWGLRDALQLGNLPVAPSFVMILLVFISLWATPMVSIVAGLILGAMLDMLNQLPARDGTDVVVLGPHALGCMLAAYTVVTMRALMFRRGVLSLAFLSVVAMAIAQIIVVSLLYVRSRYDVISIMGSGQELSSRLASAVATGVVAFPVGAALGLFKGLFGFDEAARKPFRIRPRL